MSPMMLSASMASNPLSLLAVLIFIRLLVGIVNLTADDHRGLAAVGVLDAGAGDVQQQHHRLVAAGPQLLQHAVEALAEPPQLPERVEDARGPVHSGHQPAGPGAGAVAERGLLDP